MDPSTANVRRFSSSFTSYEAKALYELSEVIQKRYETLGTTLEIAEEKFQNAHEIAQETIFNQMPLIDEMNHVFQELEAITVDPQMVAGEKGKTLFDFIDAETVQTLQRDAIEQTKEIDQLLSTHRDILQRIRGIYQFIQSFCEGKDMQYIHELLLGTNSMNNSSNSSNSSNSNSNSHSSRPQRNEMMEHSYTMTIAFFLDMEQCDQHMNRYMTSINNLYTHYTSVFHEAQVLFEELLSLRDFYHQFVASYLKVGSELQRRQRYQLEIQSIIQEATDKLRVCVEKETQERLQFTQDHGRFLPSTLCPEIKELPPHYGIIRTKLSRSNNSSITSSTQEETIMTTMVVDHQHNDQ